MIPHVLHGVHIVRYDKKLTSRLVQLNFRFPSQLIRRDGTMAQLAMGTQFEKTLLAGNGAKAAHHPDLVPYTTGFPDSALGSSIGGHR